MLDKENIEKDRWRVRRRMAIAAFLYLVFVVPAFFFAPKELIGEISGIAITVIGLMGGIIMVYIGYATADDKWQRGNE